MNRTELDRALLIYFWAILPCIITTTAVTTQVYRLVWLILAWVLLTPVYVVSVCRDD